MDPYDVEISKQVDPTARPFLRGAQALPPEASTYEDSPISQYEDNKGLPYTAIKLGYGDKMMIDPVVESKIKAIDEHIRMTMQEERLSDTKMGYDTIFNRMAERLGEKFESAKNHGNMTKLLDTLFMQVSLANRMSSKTYLQTFQKRQSEQRVIKLTEQLKQALKQFKQYGTQ